MSTIYIIEDIAEMANLVAMYLTKAGMKPCIFGTAEEALDVLTRLQSRHNGKNSFGDNGGAPDLIILDLNLPGMSGFDLLKHIAEKKLTTAPVIILSARDDDEDIIKGLGLGADEFVTKPFSPKVLVARVMSHLRRSSAAARMEEERAEDAFHFGEYTLYRRSCVLKKGDAKVPLSNKEYAVLECLVRHADEPLTPDKIYSEVWGAQYGDVTAVAVYVARLRHKIEDDPVSPRFLKTVFGRGYMFTAGSKAEGNGAADGAVQDSAGK